MPGMYKQSLTVKNMLLATGSAALGISFWAMIPSGSGLVGVCGLLPTVFFFVLAVGLLYMERPLTAALLVPLLATAVLLVSFAVSAASEMLLYARKAGF
jgi:hypothetical protein